MPVRCAALRRVARALLCSQRIPVQLAHWMCHEDALYKFTFYLLTFYILLTYLLTYLLCLNKCTHRHTIFFPGAASLYSF